jgi:excinuclease ABC subunit A
MFWIYYSKVSMDTIEIRGAKTHNLKDIHLSIPRNQLVVITGLSGSGKSSLAFDTLYAEGQRRYVESLSSYARQFLSMMEKPDVDQISGLSPAISIEQKSTSHNPRSTVGTITEIYDYLRLLFARVGQPRCPEHNTSLEMQTVSQMVDSVLAYPNDTKIMILSPVIQDRKGEHQQTLEELRAQGFVRARVDGKICALDDASITLDRHKKHTIEVVVDRLKTHPDHQQRLAESIETAITLSSGLMTVAFMEEEKQDKVFSAKYACSKCGYNLRMLEPKLFSFNNPAGACPSCDGLGHLQVFDEARVVHDEDLTLASGAVRGWDKRNFYYYHLLQSLSKHYDFSLDLPYCKLSKKIKNIILYGSKKEVITFHYPSPNGTQKREHAFEGVIPNLERRYKETDSLAVKEELSKYIVTQQCKACGGTRLNESARHVFIGDINLPTLSEYSIAESKAFFDTLKLAGWRKEIAEKIKLECQSRLGFLLDVGLDYLSLSRSAETLSGGEAQRIRLASQIGSGLVGVMYILDEPSIGLHQRDNERLLKTLKHLRDLGNTVIVVEHDQDAIFAADHVIDIGPGAGIHGGEVVAQGTAKKIMANKKSLTGQYLSGEKCIAIPKKRWVANPEKQIKIVGATGNNLKNVSVKIPNGLMTCVTGVSGSGKSTLINDTLYPAAAKTINGSCHKPPLAHESIEGLEHFNKIVDINQSPIGRTPRSNPATYTGLFTHIRDLFAGTQEARSRGYKPGRFSFNVKGGRCEACQGDGVIRVEMHFLADIYVTCDVCFGKRYNRETLEIQYKGKSIAEILNFTVEQALPFFDVLPPIKRRLQTLLDVGLSYITLGQNATTLSGGEAQRIKLSKELSKRDTGDTLYILDEPTTGLHFHDIQQLLTVLHRLRDHGNTVIVIEHNLDVIKTADWIIDLGPEGGDKGGQLLVTGTPEKICKSKKSYTADFLKELLHESVSA